MPASINFFDRSSAGLAHSRPAACCICDFFSCADAVPASGRSKAAVRRMRKRGALIGLLLVL